MKIILLQNIKNLGQAGDIKDVRDGYARNFLIPRGLAEPATKEAADRTAKKKEEIKKQEEEKIEGLKKLARILEDKEITIKVKEKDGKLFGSVGKKEIAQNLGNEISEDMIELEENIKEIGPRKIIVNIGSNIKAKVIVNISGE